jgi:hypothetical protein
MMMANGIWHEDEVMGKQMMGENESMQMALLPAE